MGMQIQNGRMANSSYTKLFFPHSENGADVAPVDVIRGCVSALAGVNAGNGSRVIQTTQAGSTTVTGATLPVQLATDSCLLFVVAGNFEIDGFSGSNLCYGDRSSGRYLRFSTSFGTTTVTIGFDASAINFTGVSSSITHPYSTTIYGIGVEIDKTARTAKLYINGVKTGDTMTISAAQAALAMNPAVNEIDEDNCHVYTYSLFTFPNGVPTDSAEAQVWMSAQHKLNNKRIWGAWETK